MSRRKSFMLHANFLTSTHAHRNHLIILKGERHSEVKMNCPGDQSTRPVLGFLTPFSSTYPRPKHRKRPTRCVYSDSELSHTSPIEKRTHIHSPVVHRYADESEESYAMWYTTHAPSTASSIHLAISPDGLCFTKIEGMHDGAVLSKNDEQWWAFDTSHVALGDVISGSSTRVRADGDVVFLYYAGVAGSHGFEDRFRPRGGRIGVALSKDGQYFSRIEGEFPNGAVLEGDEGSFDEFGVCAPCVTRVGTNVVMHYHTYSEVAGYMLGRAISEDGILFKKNGQTVLAYGGDFASRGVLNPCIVEDQGRYVMFVEVTSGKRSGIAVCESDDCEKWSPLNLVLEGNSESDLGVGSPCALQTSSGSLRLYCVRYSKDDSSLFVAESRGRDWTSFKALTMLDVQ